MKQFYVQDVQIIRTIGVNFTLMDAEEFIFVNAPLGVDVTLNDEGVLLIEQGDKNSPASLVMIFLPPEKFSLVMNNPLTTE